MESVILLTAKTESRSQFPLDKAEKRNEIL